MKKVILMSVLAASLLAGCGSKKVEAPGHFLIGFQLYSVRTELAKDFYGTLKKVSDLGFQGVEFYDEFYGHPMEEVKLMCTELGLIPFSNHVPFAKMMSNLDQVIEENTILGVQYITFPYMDMSSRPGVNPESFKTTVANIGQIGAKVREAGFQLLYHNHDFEFAKLPDGTVGHDYIFASNKPENVQVQLDICWADFAGHKAEDVIAKYADRIPVIHIKDYFLDGVQEGDPYALIGQEDNPAARNRRNAFEFRPLGTGLMNLPAVIDVSARSGVRWLCVEQDEPAKGVTDRFEGPAISAAWLREHGLL